MFCLSGLICFFFLDWYVLSIWIEMFCQSGMICVFYREWYVFSIWNDIFCLSGMMFFVYLNWVLLSIPTKHTIKTCYSALWTMNIVIITDLFLFRNVLICMIVVYLKAVVPYKEYQQLIPNGDKVPDPCHHDQIWHGVGHKNKAGGGQRNQFGDDFLRLGKVLFTFDQCCSNLNSSFRSTL